MGDGDLQRQKEECVVHLTFVFCSSGFAFYSCEIHIEIVNGWSIYDGWTLTHSETWALNHKFLATSPRSQTSSHAINNPQQWRLGQWLASSFSSPQLSTRDQPEKAEYCVPPSPVEKDGPLPVSPPRLPRGGKLRERNARSLLFLSLPRQPLPLCRALAMGPPPSLSHALSNSPPLSFISHHVL